MWGTYFVATGGLIAAAYLLLPKRLRQQRLWLTLPICVVVFQLPLALVAIVFEQSLLLTRVFFVIFNLPISYISDLPILQHLGESSNGYWPGVAIMWLLMLISWLPMPFVAGLVLDRRRRRENGVHSHS